MSPQIGTVQGAAIRVIWWEIQLKIETNPCSPQIGTVRETASNFEGVFRHFVTNLSDCFWLQATVYVHGRDNQSFPPSLVHKEWLNLALTFSAAALRGSPHSSHHQKQIQISLMVRRAGLSKFSWGPMVNTINVNLPWGPTKGSPPENVGPSIWALPK